jgi:hypothetical protein
MTLSSSSGQCEIRTCKAMSEISVRRAKRGVPVAGNMQLLVVRRRGRAGSSAALCGPRYLGLEVELLDAMTDELLEPTAEEVLACVEGANGRGENGVDRLEDVATNRHLGVQKSMRRDSEKRSHPPPTTRRNMLLP